VITHLTLGRGVLYLRGSVEDASYRIKIISPI